MTVTAAGATYFWMTNVQSRIQEDVQSNILEGFAGEMTSFTIVSSTCNSTSNNISLVLMNTGSTDISGGSMIVSLSSAAGSTLDSIIYGDFTGLSAGAAQNFEVGSDYNIVSNTNYGVKVTMPGGNSMTDSCTGT